jgi:hypothetical protein
MLWPPPSPKRRHSRWHLLLIAATTSLMAGVVVLATVLLKQMGPRQQARAAALERSEPAPAPPTTPASSAVPQAKPEPAPPQRSAPTNADDEQQLWKALGGLTRAHLYQNYLSIGLLADAVEEDLYTVAQGRTYLTSLTQIMEEVELDLSRLPETGLRPDERQVLGKVREVLVLLRAQTRELRAYWDTKEKPAADRFRKAREDAGTKLRELLRFNS